ncbi:MAG: 3-hydroxybenzoate 4-monooxygenase, partial [Salaquimonas sp.]|nr:3-hydroxybenzoate 4-monooxygenase [Salaquimonas sp.]
VLKGRCRPEILHSYSAERQAVAQDLIDFDREWARIISERPAESGGDGEETPKFQRYFIKSGHYTAGMSVSYKPSDLVGEAKWQSLAAGFDIGSRFHSAPVVRLGDAKAVEIGSVVKADARWHVFAFCPREEPALEGSAIRRLCGYLAAAPGSPIIRHTEADADIDSVIDFRAIFQQDHRELDIAQMPDLLLPKKGRFGLIDYDKMFCAQANGGPDIFDLRGIDRDKGCMVVVRPDQYVAHVLPLDAHEELAVFFDRFMLEQPDVASAARPASALA